MKNVLIIENDPDTMELYEAIVTVLGAHPVCVGEAIDVAHIDQIHPALILLDHRLDYSSGGDLCSELKTNPLTNHIPVLIVSADYGVEAIAERAGANGFIQKPFQLEEIEAAILKYIS